MALFESFYFFIRSPTFPKNSAWNFTASSLPKLLEEKKCKETNFYFFGSQTTAPVVKGDILSAEKKKYLCLTVLCYTFEKKILGGWGLLALQFTNVTRRGFQRYHWVMFYCFSVFFL